MTKPPKKALIASPDTPAKTPGFAALERSSESRPADGERKWQPKKSKKRSPIPAPLRRAVTRLARDLRKEHGLQDRPTAERLARLFQAGITPRRKPGRKPTEAVLRAAALREKGIRWPQVYERVIPGYWSLPYEVRFCHAHKLRDAVGKYQRRRKTSGS